MKKILILLSLIVTNLSFASTIKNVETKDDKLIIKTNLLDDNNQIETNNQIYQKMIINQLNSNFQITPLQYQEHT